MKRARRLLAFLILGLLWPTPGAAAIDPPPELGADLSAAAACRTVFAPDAFEGFLPTGKVTAGQGTAVHIPWKRAEWTGELTDVLGCVSVDGELVDGASMRARSVDNDGSHTHHFTVPEDVKTGSTVCQAALLVGLSATGEPASDRLDPACFRVVAEPAAAAAPAAPAAPTAPAASAAPAGPPVPKPGPDEAVVAGATETRSGSSSGPGAPTGDETDQAAPAEGPAQLSRTGAGSRPLTALAGALLILGGLGVGLGGRLMVARG